MDDILVPCPDIGYGEHAGEGVLIVIRENAGVLVVSNVDGPCHRLLVACDGGIEESPGVLY